MWIVDAFAEIDWHEYAIVQTIEFTAADATSELPPPMSVQEVESMTLAQKRMAAMIMETTAEDVEAHRARQAAADAEAAAALTGYVAARTGNDTPVWAGVRAALGLRTRAGTDVAVRGETAAGAHVGSVARTMRGSKTGSGALAVVVGERAMAE